MVKILVSLLLLLPVPAFAEEAVSVIETPAPLSTEQGGWAVIDPETNIVHGVIVCDEAFCGQNGTLGGVMPEAYQGCKAGCILRLQTKADENGNVTGLSGHSYSPDGSVSNDGSVRYNPSDQTYDITKSNADGSIVQKTKLIPSKTFADGKNISTGFENIKTKSTQIVDNETAVTETIKDNINDTSVSVEVKLSNIPDKTLGYESVESALNNIDSDIDKTINDMSINDGVVISTIKELTNKVKEFLRGVFWW